MLDLAIVLIFVAASLRAGLKSRRIASQNLDEYFLAGRTLSGWKAGSSMAATQFAADTPLLVTGLIATGGIFLLWRLWIYAIAFLALAFLFARCWRRAGALTDAALAEIRYSGSCALPLRAAKAVYYGLVMNCAVLAMVLVAALRICELVLPWHDWLPAYLYSRLVGILQFTGLSIGESITGLAPEVFLANSTLSILTVLCFVCLYSTLGGLRSVIQTDLFQLSLALIGSFAYAAVVVSEAGGLAELHIKLKELYGAGITERLLSFTPPASELAWSFYVLIGVQWFFQMNSDGTGYLAQRVMACKSDRDASFAAVLFAWLQVLIRSLPWLLIGLSLLVLYPIASGDIGTANFIAEREVLFVRGIIDTLPAGIRGIVLVSLLAALASTLDTHLNWGASYCTNDLYGRIYCERLMRREPNPKTLVRVARGSNILIVLLALIVVSQLPSIQAAWNISLLFGAGVGSVLVMRWIWERVNAEAELGSMLAALVAAPFLLLLIESEVSRLLLIALISTSVTILLSLIGPRVDDGLLNEFYRRVEPPGFWRATEERLAVPSGAGAARLRVGLQLTLVCAISLFCLLVGSGQIIIFGQFKFTALTLCAVGLGLVPIWYRVGFPTAGH